MLCQYAQVALPFSQSLSILGTILVWPVCVQYFYFHFGVCHFFFATMTIEFCVRAGISPWHCSTFHAILFIGWLLEQRLTCCFHMSAGCNLASTAFSSVSYCTYAFVLRSRHFTVQHMLQVLCICTLFLLSLRRLYMHFDSMRKMNDLIRMTKHMALLGRRTTRWKWKPVGWCAYHIQKATIFSKLGPCGK